MTRRSVPAVAGLLVLLLALPAGASAARLHGKLVVGKGSYFRMIFPDGKRYFSNPDSSARNKTYTPIASGRGAGLRLGGFQGAPSRAFDSRGNFRGSAIIRPVKFAGIRFGLATFRRDPQSHRGVPAPGLNVSGRRITGQFEALAVGWNKLYFNQGAPKPGSRRRW